MEKKQPNIFMAVNFYKHDKSVGVTKKLTSTINAFRRKGCAVYYTAYGADGIEVYDNEDQIVFYQAYGVKNEQVKSMIHRFSLLVAATRFLKETDVHFDVLFSRWLGFDPFYIQMLKAAKKNHGAFTVIDMHSYFPGTHFDDLKGKYMVWNTDLFHKTAAKYIDEMLVEGQLPQLFGKSTSPAVIGIEIDALQEHVYQGDPEVTNIISVSNEMPYHGYDRLIKSVAAYKAQGKEKVVVHLVGVVSEETKKLVTTLGLEENVKLYGKRYGQELMQIYAQCNLAAGPIAQHRIGGKKDTGLKTKEYFGLGIPYFYAGEDRVPEDYPYILQVADDESLLDMDKLVAFRRSYAETADVAKQMRAYAREHFSWDTATDIYLKKYYAEV